ncbi:MAG: malto-oligosyltrehalose synthase [Vulcanimicrobiaceae bacterium]
MISTTPTSTYRLQFSPAFRFDDARAIVPYLADLGIGHMYASPYLKARPGSTHGYDVVDPNRLNPEIGTPQEHAAMIDAAQAAGLGHLLDFVPNHMGIGGAENPWWQDVLEAGEASRYAKYFDIDWAPLRSEMRGKVLVPFLGDYYGRVLERGELVPTFDERTGSFAVDYFDSRFPLATASYADILTLAVANARDEAWPLRALAAEFGSATHERAAALKLELANVARDPGVARAIDAALATFAVTTDPTAIDRLDALLGRQNYRLAYWRVSADEINYRRFFDINDLAGLRVEDAEVLAQTHRFVFELIASNRIQGLRIDHVDGLFNPGGYCMLLQDRAEALGHRQYLVVEKIMARFETLRRDWGIAGTTGYDFMNVVNGLFVDARSELAFDRVYRQFAGIATSFDQFAYRAKKDIMRTTLASELEVLATMLDRIAGMDRRSNDYTYNVLRDALTEVLASFPVYRTYVTGEAPVPEADDDRFIGWAIGAARRRSEIGDDRVFEFIASVLTVAAADASPKYARHDILRFAMKFQQYSSPVMAKAVEDTAFYRYVRLASLNEVGGDPRRFGTSIAEFHASNSERAEGHPHAMLATATHDHKRGEDTRTRIDALSEIPGLWDRTIKRWARLNARRKGVADGSPAPTENDEYHLYQTLVGTWPMAWLDVDVATIADADLGAYVGRIETYLRKALREAKFRTSWTNPNDAYETATLNFVRSILAPRRTNAFVRELQMLVREVAPTAAVSSVAQVALKLTSPGVPDIYQGNEFWDLSLVDPDNRRPVDYAVRARTLGDMRARVERGESSDLADDVLASWTDGRIKAYVTWRLLHLRRERERTFLDGSYVPLETTGALADHVVAFARDDVITIVPRLVRRLLSRERSDLRLSLDDVNVRLAPGASAKYRDRFTRALLVTDRDERGPFLTAKAVLTPFPVAVLEPVTRSHGSH